MILFLLGSTKLLMKIFTKEKTSDKIIIIWNLKLYQKNLKHRRNQIVEQVHTLWSVLLIRIFITSEVTQIKTQFTISPFTNLFC